jgi:hypothetical protein
VWKILGLTCSPIEKKRVHKWFNVKLSNPHWRRNKTKLYDIKHEILKYFEHIRFTIHKLAHELISNRSWCNFIHYLHFETCFNPFGFWNVHCVQFSSISTLLLHQWLSFPSTWLTWRWNELKHAKEGTVRTSYMRYYIMQENNMEYGLNKYPI